MTMVHLHASSWNPNFPCLRLLAWHGQPKPFLGFLTGSGAFKISVRCIYPWMGTSHNEWFFLVQANFSPPARWGSLDFNKGATPSRRDCGHQPIASHIASFGCSWARLGLNPIASSGGSSARLGPNTCQIKCQNRCQIECQKECQNNRCQKIVR